MRKLLLVLTLLLLARSASAQTLVQCQQNSGTATNATIVTISTTAGNALIVTSSEGSNNTSTVTITDSSGTGTWTQTASGYVSNGTASRTAMWSKPNSSAVTSVTATWAGVTTTVDAIVCEVSGLITTALEDSSVNNTQSAVTTATSGSLTTTNANDILFFVTRLSGAFTSPAAGAGFSLPANGTSLRSFITFEVVSSTQAAVTTTSTWTTSLNDASIFAGFKGTGGAAAPTGINMKRKREQLEPITQLSSPNLNINKQKEAIL